MVFKRFSRFLLVSFILLAALSACAKKQVIKPSNESLQAKRAIQELGAMKDAYEAKDINGVISHVSTDYAKGYAELDTSLRKDFDTYDKISIDLKFDRVEIEGDKVEAATHWFGTWQDKSGKERQGRGNTVFVFKDTGASFQLVDVIGDSPIGISR